MIRTKALWLAALLVLAVVAGSSAAFSYPTLQGPTGLVVLPDANVVPRGSWTLAADYVTIDADDGGLLDDIGFGGDIKLIPGRLVWGVADKAELWAAYTGVSNGEGDNGHEWALGGKLQIHDDPVTGVKAAVGYGHYDADICSSCHNIKRDNIYAVVTKESVGRSPQQWRWKGSLGMTHTKLTWDDWDEHSIFQPFVGLEASQGRLALVGEYRPKGPQLDDTGMWSAGLRYAVGRNLALQAGVTNGALFGVAAHGSSAFYGLAYTFGGHRGKVEEAGS